MTAHEDLAETYQIMDAIKSCIIEEDDVCMEKYLLFWKHVCRVMGNWGTVFSFVVKDVSAKLEKLEEKRAQYPQQYRSILCMAEVENSNGTIRNRKPNRSGTGHIMVLNRALEFVVALIDGVFIVEDRETKVSGIAKTAYDQHLSQFHSWPIKACVTAALLTLPRKEEFLVRLRGKMPEEDDSKFHEIFKNDGRIIIQRVNNMVSKFGLTDYNPSA